MNERASPLGLARIWSINTRQSHKPINQATRKRNQPANLNSALVTFFPLVSRSQKSHLLLLLRLTFRDHHRNQPQNHRQIFKSDQSGHQSGNLHRNLEKYLRRHHQRLLQRDLQKYLRRHPQGHHQRLLHRDHKGIILVFLRVIYGGFCPGNEFLTIRRGLRHIRCIFLSDRLLELGIAYWHDQRGWRKRRHDPAAICHDARKSRHDGNRWSKLGAPPLHSTSQELLSSSADFQQTGSAA